MLKGNDSFELAFSFFFIVCGGVEKGWIGQCRCDGMGVDTSLEEDGSPCHTRGGIDDNGGKEKRGEDGGENC